VVVPRFQRCSCPASLAVLRPSADPASIAAAQHELGLEFPPELVASLSCHDGLHDRASLLPGRPLAVRQIVETWQMRMEIAEDTGGLQPRPWDDEPWWHPLWIPWAEAEGDAQVIDLRPGPRQGRLGWAVHDSCADFSDAWPSLTAYLHAVAEAFHVGGGVGLEYPYLTVDDELWWDSTGRRSSTVSPCILHRSAFRHDRCTPLGLER
jgi:cell wall assembly regulator SMI1